MRQSYKWRKILPSKSMMISFKMPLLKLRLCNQCLKNKNRMQLLKRYQIRRQNKRKLLKISRRKKLRWVNISKVQVPTVKFIQLHKNLAPSQIWLTAWNQPLTMLIQWKMLVKLDNHFLNLTQFLLKAIKESPVPPKRLKIKPS